MSCLITRRNYQTLKAERSNININLSSFSLRSFQFCKYLTELNCFTHYRDTFENLVVHKRTIFYRDAGKEKKKNLTRTRRRNILCYVMFADCRCRTGKENKISRERKKHNYLLILSLFSSRFFLISNKNY